MVLLCSHIFKVLLLCFCCQSPWCCPSWLCHLILLFLENGDILVVVLVTLNAVKNPRGHVLSVELRYLQWKHDDGMIIGDCPQEKSQQFWNHDNIYLYLPRLDALKHILGGVEIVLRLFVRVVQPGFDVDGYYDRFQPWGLWRIWWCQYSAHLYSGSSLSTGARTMVVVRPPSWEIKLMTGWQLPFDGLARSVSEQSR